MNSPVIFRLVRIFKKVIAGLLKNKSEISMLEVSLGVGSGSCGLASLGNRSDVGLLGQVGSVALGRDDGSG